MTTDHLAPNQRMRPGVKALILHDGKILMVRERIHRNGIERIISDFPGGGIEFGEDLLEALKREVWEEIGLKIHIEKVVGAWDFVLHENQTTVENQGVHIVCIGYQCRVKGELKIDISHNPAEEDIFEIKWFTKEELLEQQAEHLLASGMVEAVKNLEI